jgi:hypothetical protein
MPAGAPRAPRSRVRPTGEEWIVTPFFGIAGVQMRVSATGGNLETMRHHLSTLMAIYPWEESHPTARGE